MKINPSTLVGGSLLLLLMAFLGGSARDRAPKTASICDLPDTGDVLIEGQITERNGRRATLVNGGCSVSLTDVWGLQVGQLVKVRGRMAGGQIERVQYMGPSVSAQNGNTVGGIPIEFTAVGIQRNFKEARVETPKGTICFDERNSWMIQEGRKYRAYVAYGDCLALSVEPLGSN